MSSRRGVLTWIAVPLAGLLLAPSFHRGWTRVETDFPNYYTAAVLARRHMPLERFYDWTWFQRQMNYTGTERQLGGYIPQTPLTMLPMLPMSGLPPQNAKQVWLLSGLIFLALSAVLIAQIIEASPAMILLLAVAGYASLESNFLLGQYYIFLLFLMTSGVWCLLRRSAFTGGFVMGAACMLKLYTAPFLFYFAWKRQWRALAGMLAACTGLGLLSVAWFGWDANLFYLNYVFPRASENAILDPFHPATGTFTNFLRRMFVNEPELNPHPLIEAPFVFFFLRPFLTMAVLVAPLLAMRRDREITKPEIAWFLVAILLASPNTASYVFLVLLLPVALLMSGTSRRWALTALGAFILLCVPLRPAWSWMFPKVWLLLGLFVWAGREHWRNLRVRPVVVALALVAAASLWSALGHQRSRERAPASHFESVLMRPSSIYASSPAVSSAGIVFESMGAGGYVLSRTMGFDGHAFHPAVPASGTPIFFELVSHGHSRIMSFEPRTKSLEALTPEAINATHPAVTASGDRLAFIAGGTLHILGHGELATPRPVEEAAWFPLGRHLAISVRGIVYDSADGKRLAAGISGEQGEPAVSPDGTRLALTVTRGGIRHVWVEELSTQAARDVTGGDCNSYAPAWGLDSRELIFASDCGRGLGLPRLYRTPLR